VETALPPDPAPDSGVTSNSAPEATTLVPAVVPAAAPPEMPAYHDRGTGLVVFGVFQIILGLLASLMVPFVVLGAFMSRLAPGGAMRPGQVLSGVATYAFAAAALLALGIGSVRMKRWARALTLVTSWYWLIMGALVTVLVTAVLPVTMRGVLAQMKQSGPNAPSPEMSTGIMAVMLTVVIVFQGVLSGGGADRVRGFLRPQGCRRNLPPPRSRRALDRPNALARARRQRRTFHRGRYTCCWLA
jgi:hypothetical protein